MAVGVRTIAPRPGHAGDFDPLTFDHRNTDERRSMHDYVVGWGTLSLINAGLAQTKNRSGLTWWLLSLLLGPIATFLIVVWDKVETSSATNR
jgi:uncharacterized membrane protein